ncbi:MAG: hypothetical protein QM684_11605 [Rhizobium sp.]|uniref:hypothetical protein n=1 Tax=Rhizobium sp. SYY.PMSO TaxID=3382192 RepID=UPI00398FAF1D
MSHRIPVFFAPVDENLLLPAGSTPEDAYEAEEFNELHDTGALWSDTSRNWWHIYLAAAMARTQALDGLKFLEDEECITIPHGGLGAVISSIDRLLKALSEIQTEGCDESVSRYAGIVRRAEYLTELETVMPSQDNSDSTENAPDQVMADRMDAISFYRFLVSLRFVAHEAASTGKSMLWVIPAP